MPGDYHVSAYYFPNYHVDPRNEKMYGKGWTEWQLVRQALPRFPGHRQPRVPQWGYEDEADPAVFARKIEAAADHGLDSFIFDWYWYENAPFLNRALEQGYLRASNREQLKFALMWANHDWIDIMPLKRSERATPRLLYPGNVSLQAFLEAIDYVVETYFKIPTYWKIDGCPYFSIYELYRIVQSFGGVPAARQALDIFRQKTRAAGFPDLHLNGIIWGIQLLPGEQSVANPRDLVTALGLDSVTSYVWIHHVEMPVFPQTAYSYVNQAIQNYWAEASAGYGVPYYPNVTVGWDSSPRTVQSDVFDNVGYPFTPTLGDSTPAAFKAALADVRRFLDARPGQPKIMNINAWNEWTEGSYLEPDTEHGMAYLDAIRDVFKDSN